MIDERIKQIACHYGFKHQIGKCTEECAELIVALMQFLEGKATVFDVATEIADVEIMVEQMKIFFGVKTTVAEEKEAKIERQLERIEKEMKK